MLRDEVEYLEQEVNGGDEDLREELETKRKELAEKEGGTIIKEETLDADPIVIEDEYKPLVKEIESTPIPDLPSPKKE